MSFFSRAPKASVEAVFDIASGSVGAAFVKREAGKQPVILYGNRLAISSRKERTVDKYYTDMKQALYRATEALFKDGLKALHKQQGNATIKRAHIIFGSPWSLSETRKVGSVYKEQRRIDRELISHIIDEAKADFMKESADDPLFSELKKGASLIEERIFDCKVDGYDTSTDVSADGTTVSLSLFLSLVPEEIIADVTKTLGVFFHFKAVDMHSGALASLSVIRDLYPETHSFLFFDIEGEQTDIALVRGGSMARHISLPYGKNFFVRSISRQLGMNISESASLISIHCHGGCSAADEKRMDEALKHAYATWSEHLQDALGRLAEETTLPSTAFTVVGDDFSGFFAAKLKSENISQFSVAPTALSVVSLDTKKLLPHVTLGEAAIRDPLMQIATAFINKID